MYSGHVEKRSKGHYVLIIENGRDNEGKRKRIKESFKGGSREAENELARRITELESGIYVKHSKLTFGEFLKLWLKEYAMDNVTDRTYAFYEQMFEIHTIPSLGAIQLDKLKPLHLQQYYSTLKKDGRLDGKPGGLAPSTIAKHHAIIHKALKTAFKWELVAQNVSDKIHRGFSWVVVLLSSYKKRGLLSLCEFYINIYSSLVGPSDSFGSLFLPTNNTLSAKNNVPKLVITPAVRFFPSMITAAVTPKAAIIMAKDIHCARASRLISPVNAILCISLVC